MLNGIDPIIIFQFKNILPGVGRVLEKIPLVSEIPTIISAPPIPIYLSESITGLFVDSESKNIDAETDPETKTDGSDIDVDQKSLNSVVTVNLVANKNSIGVTLLSALADVAYEKLTSKEYSISYLHGPVTIFGGLLHGLSVDQNSDDELIRIKFEIARGPTKTPTGKNPVPTTPKTTGPTPNL